MALGLYLSPYHKVRSHYKNNIEKYSPFALWKWYLLMYQFVFILNILITGLFWGVLFKSKIKEPKFEDWRLLTGLIMDHAYPLIIIFWDWILISTVPFALRHALAFFPISVLYFCANVGWQAVTGEPVYHVLDWSKASAYPLFAVAVIIMIVFTFVMWKLTKIKLLWLGHKEIV